MNKSNAFCFRHLVFFKTIVVGGFLTILLCSLLQYQVADNKPRPVLIELFTSEGCSSCPPADLLLQKAVRDADANHQPVYGLAFHVDYWNRLGWIDSFSNASFSERQQNYEYTLHTRGAYTPQMVVNGMEEFVGSDNESLQKAVRSEERKGGNINFKSLSAIYQNGILQVSYQLKGPVNGFEINIALVSKRAQTAVKNGENRGRVLVHTNVVRKFISKSASLSGNVTFEWPTKDNIEIIAFLQQHNTREVMDVASAQVQ